VQETKIVIVSEVLKDEYDGHPVTSEFIKDYLEGAPAGSVVPGTTWSDVQVADVAEGGSVEITATLTHPDRIAEGEYKGDEISDEWIGSYILGADAYWHAPEVLRATSVVFKK